MIETKATHEVSANTGLLKKRRVKPAVSGVVGGHYFSVRSHAPVWRVFRTSIVQGEGVILITGEPGVGKTHFLNRIKGVLPDNRDMVQIPDPTMPPDDFLQRLLSAITAIGKQDDGTSLPSVDITHKQLLDALENRAVTGRRLLVTIDQAHMLSDDNAEILSLLVPFTANDMRPVQVLLIGRPELLGCMESEPFKILRREIVGSGLISPLTRSEVFDFIHFFIKMSVGRRIRVSWFAWVDIYSISQGNPLRIEQILIRTLSLIKSKPRWIITRSLVKQAQQRPEEGAEYSESSLSFRRVAVAVGMLLLVSTGLFFLFSGEGGVGKKTSATVKEDWTVETQQKEAPGLTGEPSQVSDESAHVSDLQLEPDPETSPGTDPKPWLKAESGLLPVLGLNPADDIEPYSDWETRAVYQDKGSKRASSPLNDQEKRFDLEREEVEPILSRSVILPAPPHSQEPRKVLSSSGREGEGTRLPPSVQPHQKVSIQSQPTTTHTPTRKWKGTPLMSPHVDPKKKGQFLLKNFEPLKISPSAPVPSPMHVNSQEDRALDRVVALAQGTSVSALSHVGLSDRTPLPLTTEETLRSAGRIFVVQIGSFSKRDNAERMMLSLSSKGFEPYVHLYEKGVKRWFSVRLNYRNYDEANKMARSISDDMQIPVRVIELFYE